MEDFDLDAAGLRADSADLKAYIEVLARKLELSLPAQTRRRAALEADALAREGASSRSASTSASTGTSALADGRGEPGQGRARHHDQDRAARARRRGCARWATTSAPARPTAPRRAPRWSGWSAEMGFLDRILGGSDDDDPARAADIARVTAGGIPLAAEQRIRELGGRRYRVHLGAVGQRLRAGGLDRVRPICQVMGSSVYKVGWQNYPWGGCGVERPADRAAPAHRRLEPRALARAGPARSRRRSSPAATPSSTSRSPTTATSSSTTRSRSPSTAPRSTCPRAARRRC